MKLHRRQLLRTAAFALTLLVVPGGASAAVRICQAPVASGLVSDPVERLARAKALAAWTSKARAAGSANASWRIAGAKLLKCARVASGHFDCVAIAQPCTISQAPFAKPPRPPIAPKRGKTKDQPIAT